ncbi:hypothetical protein ATY35_20890 [Vibrio cidicii]|uniref:Uncharacterized protein n=1 Tax=Vibrio cidicii TaxID=1763883 RepID=A0ABR5W6M1_9VIBR|nr:hypothetical protein ATY35_20890 [Vibrio cidicii]
MPHKPSFRTPLSPQISLQTKNATRHESHLNALLCFIFKIMLNLQVYIQTLFNQILLTMLSNQKIDYVDQYRCADMSLKL